VKKLTFIMDRWWQVLILLYPIGWIIGIVSLVFSLARSIRHSHAA